MNHHDAIVVGAGQAGLATRASGLCFLGLPWQHTPGSALRGWGKRDARRIAAHTEAAAGRRRSPATAPIAA